MACPPALADVVWRQVAALAAAQAGPFEGLVGDYMALLKSNRELQVSGQHVGSGAARCVAACLPSACCA